MFLRRCLRVFTDSNHSRQLLLGWKPRVHQRPYSLYDPPYLHIKPEFPSHETLNIRLRGYDFTVLESFAKYVHNMTKVFGLDSDAFPVPARTSKIQNFKPASSVVQHEYDLMVHERTVQVEDLESISAPIFFEVLQMNLPSGVQMTIKNVDPDEEEFRYVPDLMLRELQTQVADLEKAKDERKRK